MFAAGMKSVKPPNWILIMSHLGLPCPSLTGVSQASKGLAAGPLDPEGILIENGESVPAPSSKALVTDLQEALENLKKESRAALSPPEN